MDRISEKLVLAGFIDEKKIKYFFGLAQKFFSLSGKIVPPPILAQAQSKIFLQNLI
jgi:hypothetical protein